LADGTLEVKVSDLAKPIKLRFRMIMTSYDDKLQLIVTGDEV